MKSLKHGKATSEAEILNISAFGVWILVLQKEYFLSFSDFPWFQKATVEQVYHFEFLHKRHLYWPDLDIDLSLESLKDPAKFPLKSKRVSGKR
jgi:hypothetical protein